MYRIRTLPICKISLLLAMVMAVSAIKFFQSAQKFYHIIGITPPLQSNQNFPFNIRIVVILITLTLALISTTGYFLFDAKSAIEKADTFYVCTSYVACECVYLICIWKCGKIFTFIEEFDAYINSIVSNDLMVKTIYKEVDAKIERMTEIIKFLLVKVSLFGYSLPAPIITGINYFIYDLGDESYFLTFRVM